MWLFLPLTIFRLFFFWRSIGFGSPMFTSFVEELIAWYSTTAKNEKTVSLRNEHARSMQWRKTYRNVYRWTQGSAEWIDLALSNYESPSASCPQRFITSDWGKTLIFLFLTHQFFAHFTLLYLHITFFNFCSVFAAWMISSTYILKICICLHLIGKWKTDFIERN